MKLKLLWPVISFFAISVSATSVTSWHHRYVLIQSVKMLALASFATPVN